MAREVTIYFHEENVLTVRFHRPKLGYYRDKMFALNCDFLHGYLEPERSSTMRLRTLIEKYQIPAYMIGTDFGWIKYEFPDKLTCEDEHSS